MRIDLNELGTTISINYPKINFPILSLQSVVSSLKVSDVDLLFLSLLHSNLE